VSNGVEKKEYLYFFLGGKGGDLLCSGIDCLVINVGRKDSVHQCSERDEGKRGARIARQLLSGKSSSFKSKGVGKGRGKEVVLCLTLLLEPTNSTGTTNEHRFPRPGKEKGKDFLSSSREKRKRKGPTYILSIEREKGLVANLEESSPLSPVI